MKKEESHSEGDPQTKNVNGIKAKSFGLQLHHYDQNTSLFRSLLWSAVACKTYPFKANAVIM